MRSLLEFEVDSSESFRSCVHDAMTIIRIACHKKTIVLVVILLLPVVEYEEIDIIVSIQIPQETIAIFSEVIIDNDEGRLLIVQGFDVVENDTLVSSLIIAFNCIESWLRHVFRAEITDG